MNVKHFYALIKKSVNAWIDDYAPSMGAAISYYTVFSISPLLIIVIAVAGMVWGREAVQGQIVDQLSGLMGKDAAIGIQGLIESANQPAKGMIATIISIIILIIGATTVFAELQSALDRVWDVPAAKKASGIWATLRARLLSLGFILGLGFLLSVSLVLSAGVAAFGSWSNSLFPGWELILQLVNIAVSLGVATLLFAMIFKLMPQAKVGWHDVWIGAFVTAVLFEIGKALIGLYIGKSSVASSFAAAGSLVVLLIWVYYSAQIFLLGAEFTWAYAHDHGSLSKDGKPVEATAGARLSSDSSTDKGEKGAASDAPHRSVDSSTSGTAAPELSDHSVVIVEPPSFKQRVIAQVASRALLMVLTVVVKRQIDKFEKRSEQHGQPRQRHRPTARLQRHKIFGRRSRFF